LRGGLRLVIPRRSVFGALLKIGQSARPWLPNTVQRKIPTKPATPKPRPVARHARRMLMLEGCVQPSLSPNTNAAAARVLDKLGITVVDAPRAGCCGATDYHLDAQEKGLERARRNIDAWWPAIEAGAQAIVQTASGCGAFVKEYGKLLRGDPLYAEKAKRVSELAVAFHCPCTMQHAQKLGTLAEQTLRRLGFHLSPVADAHLCCGSAGTYSITQPALSRQLRDNKLDALESGKPDVIATANIGCQMHLASAGRTPVRHWVELLDEALR
jgi:glycolate oxidase iron-sulfur subunit